MRTAETFDVGCLKIRTEIPVIRLLNLQISHKENEHARTKITVYVNEEFDTIGDFEEQEIQIYNCQGDVENILFHGIIEKVVYTKENHFILAEIHGISLTIRLQSEVRNRSFQNPELTYSEIIGQVVDKLNGRFIAIKEFYRKTGNPVIQYQETDWDFLIRMASHIHTVIYPEVTTGRVDVWVGSGKGDLRDISKAEILKRGISDRYFRYGGYKEGHNRNLYRHLQVRSREVWKIGDEVSFCNQRYIVFQRLIEYLGGELISTYELGAECMTFRSRKSNKILAGARLTGEIRKVKEESVWIQLDIDEQEGAEYAWPWTPEVGNLCYLMPEERTRAVLYFPTQDEKDGIALHNVNERNSVNGNKENKEYVTSCGKKMGIYPDEIVLSGSLDSIYLSDRKGIQFNSQMAVQMSAGDHVYISGKKINVTAPVDIVCHTNSSNIELCKNINIYAPLGVINKGDDSSLPIEVERIYQSELIDENEAEPEFRQVSFAALAAIPVTVEANTDSEVDLKAMGSVAKIADGKVTYAMYEVMKGVKAENANFADALNGMDIYTFKGSIPL